MYKEANRDEDDESNRPGGAVLTREVGIPTGGHASRLSQRLCSAPPKFGLCLSLVSALCLKSTLFPCLCLCLCFCFCLLQQPVNFLWASRVAEGASNVSASSCWDFVLLLGHHSFFCSQDTRQLLSAQPLALATSLHCTCSFLFHKLRAGSL